MLLLPVLYTSFECKMNIVIVLSSYLGFIFEFENHLTSTRKLSENLNTPVDEQKSSDDVLACPWQSSFAGAYARQNFSIWLQTDVDFMRLSTHIGSLHT